MSELRADTVFILGTGARIGSGYPRCGRQLPDDAGFFANDTGRYYALDILLAPFGAAHGNDLHDVGVEAVWTYLEFAVQEPYRHIHPINNEIERRLEQIRQPRSHADDEHALVSEWRRNYTRPTPNDIDFWLVAGWDLRPLWARVYDELEEPNGEHDSYGRMDWGHQELGSLCVRKPQLRSGTRIGLDPLTGTMVLRARPNPDPAGQRQLPGADAARVVKLAFCGQ